MSSVASYDEWQASKEEYEEIPVERALVVLRDRR